MGLFGVACRRYEGIYKLTRGLSVVTTGKNVLPEIKCQRGICESSVTRSGLECPCITQQQLDHIKNTIQDLDC